MTHAPHVMPIRSGANVKYALSTKREDRRTSCDHSRALSVVYGLDLRVGPAHLM